MNTKHIEDVVVNGEVITLAKNADYLMHQKQTYVYMNAQPLSEDVVEGVSSIESTIYNYLCNQGLELLISEPKYSTALINFPDYKAVCVEMELIGEEQAEERLCALSHELGHYLDVKFNHNGDSYRFNAVYNSDKSTRITMELVAWIYGRDILRAMGYENDKFFINQMLLCLSTYVGNMEKTAKICKNAIEIVNDYENECKKVLEIIVK